MNIETYIPTELLKPFIKGYRIIQSKGGLVNTVLPDTSLAASFRFKGQVNYIEGNGLKDLPSSAISGLRKSARIIKYSQDTGTLIILFSEMGAAAFFKNSLHELFEQSVSIDNFISRPELSIVEEKLATAQNNMQRIAIIEQFLLSKLYNAKPDILISTALQKIHSSSGVIKVKELANELFISQDAFEKRFRKIVGSSPKQFSSIIRMRSAIQNMKPKQTFTRVAFDAGYFDQSHFNKDFKSFTGQTPSDFFESSPSFW
jgi:AraC-like DNA-binding protein